MRQGFCRAVFTGWVGGLIGNALLGALFSSPWITAALYDPARQSQLFVEITAQRNIIVSVVGLIVLSGLHGALFHQLESSIPGGSWLAKGMLFGVVLWAVYWLFQEWFIYVMLLKEPLPLALLELTILLLGSLLEGVVIAWFSAGRVQSGQGLS